MRTWDLQADENIKDAHGDFLDCSTRLERDAEKDEKGVRESKCTKPDAFERHDRAWRRRVSSGAPNANFRD